jgi:predicted house-cleaning noncanonical NTP pyrophosphatase (MazG superfamily)
VKVLKQNEFLNSVKKKIFEEAGELIHSKNKKDIIDEITDIQELLDVLATEMKLTKPQVKKLQVVKAKKRGGFKKRLFLIKEEKNKLK